jgi:hypothetical protein
MKTHKPIRIEDIVGMTEISLDFAQLLKILIFPFRRFRGRKMDVYTVSDIVNLNIVDSSTTVGYVSRAEILDDPDCLFSGNPFKLITPPALKW